MKAYFIASDTHIRKIRLIADVTAEIFKIKTVALEICSSMYIEAQAGFRKNMSTTDNIIILNSLITHVLNQNEKSILCIRRLYKSI